MRILVLGASGMLGSAVFRLLSEKDGWNVYGTVRAESSKRYFQAEIAERLISGVDVDQPDTLMKALVKTSPDVVINCIGLVKQLEEANDPLQVVPINTLLPHRLARLCELSNSRLVHISTDCIFSGAKGGYCESDPSDALDLYGRSKYLGEVSYPHTVTLRTSMIGHELHSKHSLIDWFLSQGNRCEGYSRVVFSGLPTVVLANIIRNYVITHPELSGVYHVASDPISKYDLLRLVAEVYGKSIEIVLEDKLVVDRSLNASRFRDATGFVSPEWKEMIELMFADHLKMVK